MSSTRSENTKEDYDQQEGQDQNEANHNEKLKRIIIGAYQPINAILTMIREFTFIAAYDESTLANRIQAHN